MSGAGGPAEGDAVATPAAAGEPLVAVIGDKQAAPDPIALVEAWRATGAAGDPVGLAVIEALARRAAAQQGEARRWMLQRLQARMAAQARGPGEAGTDDAAAAPGAQALAALTGLVDRLGRAPAPASPAAAPVRPTGSRRPAPVPPTAVVPQAGLKSVAAHQATWSRLRAEQRLRQALAQVPPMAGPLNSSQVVHRALKAMHALSPAYLDAFLAHADALMWLEQSAGAADPLPRPASAAEGRRRGGATLPRKG